jgi:acyl carrier protein
MTFAGSEGKLARVSASPVSDGVAEHEQKIAAIVCRIGKIERLEPEQDYFDAGLASIQALELLADLEAEFEVTLPDEGFVQARTVRALGNLVVAARNNNAGSTP